MITIKPIGFAGEPVICELVDGEYMVVTGERWNQLLIDDPKSKVPDVSIDAAVIAVRDTEKRKSSNGVADKS